MSRLYGYAGIFASIVLIAFGAGAGARAARGTTAVPSTT